MFKQYGRSILAKVENHEGQFIEWVQEIDSTRNTPASGVYYLNVDSFSDETNKVGLTIQTYRWVEGNVKNAMGSIVYLRPGIDGTTLLASLAVGGCPPLARTTVVNDGSYPTTIGSPPIHVDVLLSPNVLFLLAPTPAGLELFTPGSPPTALVPLVDYWYPQEVDVVLIQSTNGQPEIANIPGPFLSFKLVDQTGYELRQGVDYNWYATNGWIQTTQTNPVGSTIIAKVIQKASPLEHAGTNPENILPVGLGPNETLASGQVIIQTTTTTYTNATPNSDGTVTLQTLLLPGQSARWEVRIDSGQQAASGKKWSLNETLIPGLRIAIGDRVLVNDQAAIIVSPTQCETYEVFGSKDNIDLTLECRANDLQTASDISELLKEQLLILRRENMEADGVTVFEARRAYRGVQRDQSGTAPQYSYDVSVTAMADWKVYIPLVTRLVDLEISETEYATPERIVLTPRVRAFGNTGFLQSYS